MVTMLGSLLANLKGGQFGSVWQIWLPYFGDMLVKMKISSTW